MLETDKSGMYRLRTDPVTDAVRECAAGKDSGDEESRGQGKERKEDVLRQARELGIPVSFSSPVIACLTIRHPAVRISLLPRSTLVQIKRNLDQYGESAVEELIQRSIRNGWRGIFFERLGNSAKSAPAEYGSPEDLFA